MQATSGQLETASTSSLGWCCPSFGLVQAHCLCAQGNVHPCPGTPRHTHSYCCHSFLKFPLPGGGLRPTTASLPLAFAFTILVVSRPASHDAKHLGSRLWLLVPCMHTQRCSVERLFWTQLACVSCLLWTPRCGQPSTLQERWVGVWRGERGCSHVGALWVHLLRAHFDKDLHRC